MKHPKLHDHFSYFECFTIEAAFTSQVITLFVYNASQNVSTSIFEMFLVFGSQVILDVIAFMVSCTESKMLKLEELELLNFTRDQMMNEVLSQYSINYILSKSPIVYINESII